MAPPPVPACADTTLVLDFDGTLVELAEIPDAVEVGPGLVTLLETLSGRLDGRLALVSGRDVSVLQRWFSGAGAILVGNHGAEFADEALPRPEVIDQVARHFRQFAARHGGVLAEEKRYGAALHYRRAPDAEAACHALAHTLAAQHGLRLQHGKCMIEVCGLERDKGWAVRMLMARPGHSGTNPVFLGDDITDEAGFAAAQELGGFGVLVGSPRPSAAAYSLNGVAEVHSWLERLCART